MKLFKCLTPLIFVLFAGCIDYSTLDERLGEKIPPVINWFAFETENNSQLKNDIEGKILNNNTILIKIDHELSSYVLNPTITIHEGLTINPSGDTPIDATNTNIYTVSNREESKEYEIIFDMPGAAIRLISLKVNNTPTYYNKTTNTYHIPVESDKWEMPLKFELIGTGYETSYLNGEVFDFSTTEVSSLEFGEVYELSLGNDEEIINYKFILNALPIVSIKSEGELDDIPSKYSEVRAEVCFSIFDPTDDGAYSYEQIYAGIKKRGASSLGNPKKSYSLEFCDKETKEEIDTHLFGLRKDGDWILDGACKDQLRMRNRVCMDLWNDIHTVSYIQTETKAKTGTRGRFVEIYFNDEYIGVYCINERIDRKQLDLNKNGGYLYKAEGWDQHIMFEGYDAEKLPKLGDERWEDGLEGYQAEYPKSNDWEPLVKLVKFVCDSDDDTFNEHIAEYFELKNAADFMIFINVIGGTENSGQNTFIGKFNNNSIDPRENRFFYAPWDLDAVLGRFSNNNKIGSKILIGIEKGGYGGCNMLFHKLLNMENPVFRELLKERWAELKNDVCTSESIVARFRAYQLELEKCGALDREKERWGAEVPIENPNTEIDYIETWVAEQIAYFDNYVQGLSTE